MNAASIPQARSTLRRSLFSPTDGDLLTPFRDSTNQIVSPVFVRTKGVGPLFAFSEWPWKFREELPRLAKGQVRARPKRTGPSLLKGAMFRDLSCEPRSSTRPRKEDCAYQRRNPQGSDNSGKSALSLKRHTLR